MTDYTHTDLKLVGLHEPEYSIEPSGDGNFHRVQLPGFYTVGTEVDGVFVPLVRIKAGRLLQQQERAEQQKRVDRAAGADASSASQQQSQQTPPPSQSSAQ